MINDSQSINDDELRGHIEGILTAFAIMNDRVNLSHGGWLFPLGKSDAPSVALADYLSKTLQWDNVSVEDESLLDVTRHHSELTSVLSDWMFQFLRLSGEPIPDELPREDPRRVLDITRLENRQHFVKYVVDLVMKFIGNGTMYRVRVFGGGLVLSGDFLILREGQCWWLSVGIYG